MAIRYVWGKDVVFTSHDDLFLDATLSNGEKFYNLEPRSLFTISDFYRYVSMQNGAGDEEFILMGLQKMPEEQQKIVKNCLEAYYRMPKIKRIIKRNDTNLMWVWTVETDKGIRTIEMVAVLDDLKLYGDRRVLIKDSKSNRYEIPDIYKLSKKDFKSLINEL